MSNIPNNNKYNIIYADPPWKYATGDDGHYPRMSFEELEALNVPEIADTNSYLFLWGTAPMLQESLLILDIWGFWYKTVAFAWIKRNKINKQYRLGNGRYTRSNIEFCLLGTKGNLTVRSHTVNQIIDEPIRKHSQKPDIVRDRIVELLGDIPRIELFARSRHEGWDAWGNEV